MGGRTLPTGAVSRDLPWRGWHTAGLEAFISHPQGAHFRLLFCPMGQADTYPRFPETELVPSPELLLSPGKWVPVLSHIPAITLWPAWGWVLCPGLCQSSFLQLPSLPHQVLTSRTSTNQ